MSECNHDCSNCKSSDCSSRKSVANNIKKIYAVHSGKGGVGKSFVTSMLANQMAKKGYKVGILDADITGPSIPLGFGVTSKLSGTKDYMIPAMSKNNIKIVSVNLLLDNASDPVAWRGPILANAVKQFFEQVLWGDLDYLFIDMPPGTADIVLTVYQSIKMDGVLIVSTPQDLVSMVVEKSVNLAKKMNVNILGLVENMSFITCDDCGNKLYPFGQSKHNYEVKKLASLPIIPQMNQLIDAGRIDEIDYPYLNDVLEIL